MCVSIQLPRVERGLETFVVLDNLIDVGLVGGGGHADGERHFSISTLLQVHLGFCSTY